MINVEEMMNQMKGGKPQSVLTRKPTNEELDTFIDRVLDEKDETPFTMAQAILYTLNESYHSIVEAEIYPMVLARMEERGMIKFSK